MSTKTPPRIFFDTNEGTLDGGYWLTLDRSKEDLSTLGNRLREGEEILIWMPGELEMRATLRFERADVSGESRWIADPIAGTMRHLDQG